jgi:hypothetical protein
MFKDKSLRPLVIQHYIERKYGINNLINNMSSSLEKPIPQYSSLVLTHIFKLFPGIVIDYQKEIIDVYLNVEDQTIAKNILFILSKLSISPYREMELLNNLMLQLKKNNTQIVSQVYAIKILSMLCLKHPMFKNEIMYQVETLVKSNASPSIKIAFNKFKKLNLL